MSHNPVTDIQNYLDAQTTALTKGTNLFRGPVRAHSAQVPVQSVFVTGYGGPAPDRVLGTATEIRYPRVQVTVRSSAYDSGYDLAWTVYNSLQSATPTTTNTYMDVRALQSEPNFLEHDKNLHCFWTLNFAVMYQST